MVSSTVKEFVALNSSTTKFQTWVFIENKFTLKNNGETLSSIDLGWSIVK